MHAPPTADVEVGTKLHMLTRTWWSLRSLDCFLSSALRRPAAVSNEECGSPQQNHLQDNHSLLWLAAQLTVISHSAIRSSILQEKHNSGLQNDDWRYILKVDLYKLRASIQIHESLLLKFSWHDAMILVTRPLSYPDTQCDTGKPLNNGVPTRECTDAALGLTRLLSNQPTMDLFQSGPWWSLVHYILRALSVLLPVAIDSSSQKDSFAKVVTAVEKLIGWLRWLSDKDRVASTALKPILHAMRQTSIWAGSRIAADEEEDGTGVCGFLRPVDEWGFSVSDMLYPQFEASADQLANLSPFVEDLAF